MNNLNQYIYKALGICFTGIAVGLIMVQLKTNPPQLGATRSQLTPTQTWQEQPRELTAIEQATMSGDFQKEFQDLQKQAQQPPKPTPIFTLDIPSSMAGDLIPPTATINGGPANGSTISYRNVCFPLFVSDNMTPWQQLATRAQLDDRGWSNWMNMFSYCFENLGDGPHTVQIQIKDLAGNTSQDIKRVFIIKS